MQEFEIEITKDDNASILTVFKGEDAFSNEYGSQTISEQSQLKTVSNNSSGELTNLSENDSP